MSGEISTRLYAANPQDACAPIAPMVGFALIARGDCDFTVKISNAVQAGASGVVVYSQAGNPKVIMGGTATAETLSIPGVMVDNAVGVELLQKLAIPARVQVTLGTGHPHD